MKAMILDEIGPIAPNEARLKATTLPEPRPGGRDILVRINACGVCHTELDEIEGRTPPPHLPVIPGHQIVGRVEEAGPEVTVFKAGDRVGVGWIYSACGNCRFCLAGNDNLCPQFMATGRDVNGGYAEYVVVPAQSAFLIPDTFSDIEAAPLLCAGAIGYRSLQLANLVDGQNIGFTGFGASAHLMLQVARRLYPSSKIFVFARSTGQQELARDLGAAWSGDTDEHAPEELGAIIDTTPAWLPVVEALKNLEPGGRLVINAIRKEEKDKKNLLQLNYPTHLWMEKEIKSVANISRSDIKDFLGLAAKFSLKPLVQEFPLSDANQALTELKTGKIHGAKVLHVN